MTPALIQEMHSKLNVVYQNLLVSREAAVAAKVFAESHQGSKSVALSDSVIEKIDEEISKILPVLEAYSEAEGLQ